MSLVFPNIDEEPPKRLSLWETTSVIGDPKVLSTAYMERASFQSEIPTIWEGMMIDYYKEREELELYKREKQKKDPQPQLPPGSVVEYMEDNVFSVLFPALNDVLLEAVSNNSLTNQLQIFDPLDMIAQLLWNRNPKYPDRLIDNLYIHDMPWAQKILETHPRQHFPKSWIFSQDRAATLIQAYYRGYLVRKTEEVQEMRQFWSCLKNPDQEKFSPSQHLLSYL